MAIIFLWLVASFPLVESMDHWGTEFLVTFVPNFDQLGHNALYLTARQPSDVYVENTRFGISSMVKIAAKGSARVQLTPLLQYTSLNVVEDKTVYVNATSPISVYALNFRNGTADMHIVYPTKTMGTSYVMASYPPTNGVYFLVAALYDNTHVQVLLKLSPRSGSCFGASSMDGDVLNQTLHSRQVWGDACSTNLLGSLVYSDKPISVTVGLACDFVPIGVSSCDHMEETLIPVDDLGNTYVLHDVMYRNSGVIYHVISPYADNVITESTGATFTLQQGQHMEYDLQKLGMELCISSSKPVMTIMFTKGGDTDHSVPFGDPAMAVVPAAEKFTADYIVNMELVPKTSFERYVAITIDKENTVGLVVPGIVTPFFNSIGCDLAVAHVALDAGSHWIRHSSNITFGAILYAFGYQVGLATPAGMTLIDKYDYCSSDPCLNGATCINDSDLSTFRCFCLDGFHGAYCQNDIDDCLSHPCKNGATCIDRVNAFDCTCMPGFSGRVCDVTGDTQEGKPRSTPLFPQKSSTGVGQRACTCRPVIRKFDEQKQKAQEHAEVIRNTLRVDKCQLSSTKRKVMSVTDNRPSANSIGYVGVAFLVIVFCTVVFIDLTALILLIFKPSK